MTSYKTILEKDWLWISTLFVFFLFRYHEQLLTEWIFGQYHEGTYMFPPLFSYISTIFRQGETPYWIPGLIGGMPIYNSPMFSLEYPFYFFGILDYGEGYEAMRWMARLTLLHIAILGLNTYILVRCVGGNAFGAFVGGSLVMLAMNVAVISVWLIIIAAYSWLPLFISGVLLILRQPERIMGSILLAISCLGFTADPAQPLIHAAYLGGFLVLTGFYIYRTKVLVRIKNFLFAGCLCFGLSAVGIIPTVLEYKDMMRFIGDGKITVGFDDLDITSIKPDLPHSSWLEIILFPKDYLLYGPGHHYIGPVAVLLSIIGVFFIILSKDRKLKYLLLIFTILGLYFLMSSFGNTYGFTSLNYQLPLLNKVREPIRHAAVFSLVTSVLAGLGISLFISKNDSNGIREYRVIEFVLLVGLILAFIVLCMQLNRSYPFNDSVYLLIGGMIVAYFLAYQYFNQKAIYVGLVFLLFFNGFLSHKGGRKIAVERLLVNSKKNIISMKVVKELSEIESIKEHRISFHPPTISKQYWSMNALYGDLKTLNTGFYPIPFEQYKDYFKRVETNFFHFYSMAGVKWHLYHKDSKVDIRYLKPVKDILWFKLYENSRALPKYYILDQVKLLAPDLVDFEKKISLQSDLSSLGYVEQDILEKSRLFLAQPIQLGEDSTIKEIQTTHNKKLIEATINNNSILVLNEYFSNNWKVRLNGCEITPFRINHNQIGIFVEKGKHKVEYEYSPNLYKFLKWIQRITMVFIVLLLGSFVTGYNRSLPILKKMKI